MCLIRIYLVGLEHTGTVLLQSGSPDLGGSTSLGSTGVGTNGL